MIEDEDVDLVVDVGDFDYWGRCTETYELLNDATIESLTGSDVYVPVKSKLKRVKWQDGRHGSIKGWEIGVQLSSDETAIERSTKLTLDGDLYERHVIKDKIWDKLIGDLKLKKGVRDCNGYPWDGKLHSDAGNDELLLI